MLTSKHILQNENDSEKLATKLANNIQPGTIITFSGDLGSGKTFLCRNIIQTLCGKETKVISPTFNLLQIYDYKNCQIYHFDLYRLKHISEIYELGIEEAFNGNICLIEWPEIINNILPEETIRINIKLNDANQRHVSIENHKTKLI